MQLVEYRDLTHHLTQYFKCMLEAVKESKLVLQLRGVSMARLEVHQSLRAAVRLCQRACLVCLLCALPYVSPAPQRSRIKQLGRASEILAPRAHKLSGKARFQKAPVGTPAIKQIMLVHTTHQANSGCRRTRRTWLCGLTQ